ncbi:uncharacterized protein UV8b_07293 [Ustilaginoidea virens]|uniref:Uncharacterized protein n=1 Tax=Ustilaginoidea virens TaxID=1159556 RepID=A0A8E5HX22_USTVR|nr:uncharacterized protein UV8b_07293 [Ustilaginoidea virens]QUC23052.1 hypothetical protein UV8b_07293 [Ustilaginoidea virens]
MHRGRPHCRARPCNACLASPHDPSSPPLSSVETGRLNLVEASNPQADDISPRHAAEYSAMIKLSSES